MRRLEKAIILAFLAWLSLGSLADAAHNNRDEKKIHIPKFNVSKEAVVGRPLEVTFTARELGVFPVYCNGDCPTGDGQQFGQVVVMQLEGDDRTLFREISAKEAEQLIHSTSPLILDVRTSKEFYQSHLPGAVLMPIQQLQDRVRELEAYKDKDVLIYCRSGNRSTVAANILMGAGFKRLHNLRHGIIEWERENLTLIQ